MVAWSPYDEVQSIEDLQSVAEDALLFGLHRLVVLGPRLPPLDDHLRRVAVHEVSAGFGFESHQLGIRPAGGRPRFSGSGPGPP